jgi:hypothetical protein
MKDVRVRGREKGIINEARLDPLHLKTRAHCGFNLLIIRIWYSNKCAVEVNVYLWICVSVTQWIC